MQKTPIGPKDTKKAKKKQDNDAIKVNKQLCFRKEPKQISAVLFGNFQKYEGRRHVKMRNILILNSIKGEIIKVYDSF